ncbi:hypothetical protein HGRIS_004693 [Hohenbuehelia grisea]|uniref:Xylanolytic transcriptional activator regulatory domain-containing protein n=1 Tax=Hohenbuehelia grisea TaxID=104357 RepID=A0ABR3JCM9_9AGAR
MLIILLGAGSLTTGKGNRFVLANTEVLHDKIGQLSTRVRQLEDALAQSHAMVSNERHPLLSEDLLQIKRPLERDVDSPPHPPPEKVDANEAVDALGSLSISQGGRTTFFGTTANSWYLLQNEEGSEEEDTPAVIESSQPSEIPWLSYSFPFSPPVSKTSDDIRITLYNMLPTATVARKYCDNYYRRAAWMYTPVPEIDFYESVFRSVYPQETAQSGSVSSHNLALLYVVLALGALLDLERPGDTTEATHYYQLGRAALSLESIFEEQSIPAIQALMVMCHYMFLSHIDGPRWAIMGLVVKLALSVGLHRDSGKWHLDADETRKRRQLLWEIYVYDSWQSLTFGRPPSFSLFHIDSKLPFETTHNGRGDVEMSFPAWKHRFCSQCLSIVHDQAFGARNPSYKTIQTLDKSVRDFYVPPSLQVPGFGGAKGNIDVDQPSIELTLQRYIVFAIKEITLFYMHRGFFARALEDQPADPMGSPFAPSVLAAYTSACTFVGLIESLYKQHSTLAERMWFLFTHVFSCSIVLGSIAVKTKMALAPSALSHLEAALNLFNQVSENPRAAKVLPILRKLVERAHSSPLRGHLLSPQAGAREPIVKKEVDELSALGGMTRLVSRRTPSSPTTPSQSASPISQHASPPPQVKDIPSPTFSGGAPASPWAGYQPIRNYNEFPQYSPVPSHVPQQDIPYTYTSPVPEIPMGSSSQAGPLPAEAMSNYYANGFQDASSNQLGYWPYPQGTPQSPGDLYPISSNDLNDSWHSLMAQFNKG